MEEALDEIIEEETQKKNLNNTNILKNYPQSKIKEENSIGNIEIKGNTIKYQNRLFLFNYNASKYEAKINRKIFHCQYHYHQINKLSQQKLPPFCSMKITYYPDNEEDAKFKITGEHSYECIEKYNEERTDKREYLDNF